MSNVRYVGERVGRYTRYERQTRKNADRWMIPQPVRRRTNRWYEEPAHDNNYWPCVIGLTTLATVALCVIWWIAG